MVFVLGASRPKRHRSIDWFPRSERLVRFGALPDRTVGRYQGPINKVSSSCKKKKVDRICTRTSTGINMHIHCDLRVSVCTLHLQLVYV